MAIDTSKNSYTIIFSILMVVVVGTLLAGVSSALRPQIKANKEIEKMQNILFAMGITDAEDSNAAVPASEAKAMFEKYIGDAQYIIQGDKVTKTPKAFGIVVKKEQDKVKQDANYQPKLELYVGEKDGGKSYIVSMRGNGLWDAIWAYMALDKDMVVQGAFFDHKGETPGLGANIKEPFFRDDFKGEHVFDKNGNFKGIMPVKGNADPKNLDKTDNEVDAIAGATITSTGLGAMVKNGLKQYVPYFKTLKNK